MPAAPIPEAAGMWEVEMILKPGTVAFALIEKTAGGRSRSGDRAILEGAAQVKVIDHHDGLYHTEVVKGSGVPNGSIRVFTREELYSTKEERRYFEQLVNWLWGGIPRTMKRPPVEEE